MWQVLEPNLPLLKTKFLLWDYRLLVHPEQAYKRPTLDHNIDNKLFSFRTQSNAFFFAFFKFFLKAKKSFGGK
jgi:hypothetical protein